MDYGLGRKISAEHHRRTTRLKGYDYSQAGYYFITICVQSHRCLLGENTDAGVKLTPIGEIVRDEWLDIPHYFNNVKLDSFIVMPNHIHGIIIIVGATFMVAQNGNPGELYNKRAGMNPAPTLGEIIGSFKSRCVHKCIQEKLNVYKFWQRNYYEHIIRNEEELYAIREYIQNNPMNWKLDRENPDSERFGIDQRIYWQGIYSGTNVGYNRRGGSRTVLPCGTMQAVRKAEPYA